MADEKPGEGFVDTHYAEGEGGAQYRAILEEAKASGKCPFCPGELGKRNIVLDRDGRWVLFRNLFPYKNSAVHFLIVPVEHLSDLEDIAPADWASIMQLFREAKVIDVLTSDRPALREGGALAVRFGLTSGVTIRHIHFHVIAPKVDPATDRCDTDKHVVFPIG